MIFTLDGFTVCWLPNKTTIIYRSNHQKDQASLEASDSLTTNRDSLLTSQRSRLSSSQSKRGVTDSAACDKCFCSFNCFCSYCVVYFYVALDQPRHASQISITKSKPLPSRNSQKNKAKRALVRLRR